MNKKHYQEELKDLFKFFREDPHEVFFSKIEMYRCKLGHLVVKYNKQPDAIIADVKKNKWTGKNEFAAKVLITIGGTKVLPPKNIIDAANQLKPLRENGENVLSYNENNYLLWTKMVEKIKEQDNLVQKKNQKIVANSAIID